MCSSSKPKEFRLVESLRNIENNGEMKSCENRKEKCKLISIGKNLKWTCPKCTYENWQKSTKCIICHHLRNKSYKEDTKGAEKNLINERNVKSKKSSSPRRSPPRSPNTLSRKSGNIFEIPKQEDEKDP